MESVSEYWNIVILEYWNDFIGFSLIQAHSIEPWQSVNKPSLGREGGTLVPDEIETVRSRTLRVLQ